MVIQFFLVVSFYHAIKCIPIKYPFLADYVYLVLFFSKDIIFAITKVYSIK